jgi:hypothetical protein
MIFLILASSKSSVCLISNIDSGRMRWISPFGERFLTIRDFGNLLAVEYASDGENKFVRIVFA